jgi:hypothetical protein
MESKLTVTALYLVLQLTGASAWSAPVLTGRDRISGQPCSLNILNISEDGSGTPTERFRAQVQTTYSHEGATPPVFEIRFAEPGVLVGTDPSGESNLRVTLPAGSLDLREARAFRLRWLHGDHFHDSVCLQLAVQ